MSLHNDITNAISRQIEELGSAIALSPTSVALAVQRSFSDEAMEPHVQYTSLEHIKHMARKALSGRFEESGDENDAHQGDMFSGQLQDRYPVPRERGADPIYKLREHLSTSEAQWNVETLRKAANARLRHADALDAWNSGRDSQRCAA
jgi:hypothetical protein